MAYDRTPAMSLIAATAMVVTTACGGNAQAQQTPPAPAAPPPGADAESMFATTCGWCHSDGGREAGKGPKLMGTSRSDDFIVNRIKNGKEGAMPSFRETYNDEQIGVLLKYIRSLKAD
jgi:mono/diheme cytochrome c family protein